MLHFSLLDYTTYSIIFISISLGLIISGVILGLSYVLAVSSPDPEKNSAYECGFEPFGNARLKTDNSFVLISLLFLVFDLEIIFLLPWVIHYEQNSYFSFLSILFFLILLMFGFLIEWLRGILNLERFLL